ncbi:hypothetical protein XELAEV_18045515mg [Xenopus laevis]|uniref:Uncharacterized protein n=1 Tax=Xenopus laevis TaxID=8355 RepID=A0A974C131_XENLA|nr:hypothetical protein XELAEV_18045515mg [Xenopus laevis]
MIRSAQYCPTQGSSFGIPRKDLQVLPPLVTGVHLETQWVPKYFISPPSFISICSLSLSVLILLYSLPF